MYRTRVFFSFRVTATVATSRLSSYVNSCRDKKWESRFDGIVLSAAVGRGAGGVV